MCVCVCVHVVLKALLYRGEITAYSCVNMAVKNITYLAPYISMLSSYIFGAIKNRKNRWQKELPFFPRPHGSPCMYLMIPIIQSKYI